ncbi:DNA-directed RNA polymerase subunit epsilon [Companilactobacillus sp. HBUAS56275]|uniref:DNA-directed RNA polymerase subunit epsilon n=1 Tax=Candidatus Companilactobacillus pullicola TaxID=2838523 RepID=A0A9D1ZQD0_9LACO|nr:DNA-dependent RNA polymerase auxiliary subunit epsilon family protein [Candidatus Companilactobacillus pullicola]
MIYKVLYQTSELDNPRREFTHSLYMDAESNIAVREAVEKNTDYNIEFIQELDEKHLEYEKKSPDFKLTEF